MTLRELYDKRNQLVKQMRDILDKAEKEERQLTQEDRDQYDKLEADVDKLGEEIKTLEQDEKRSAKLKALEELEAQPAHQPGAPQKRQAKPGEENPKERTAKEREERLADIPKKYRDLISTGARGSVEYEGAFSDYLVRGECVSGESRQVLAHVTEDYIRVISQFPEMRALQADLDTAGGYLVAPEQFVARLIMALDDAVFVRNYATVIPVANAASLGAPSLDNDPADPEWTAEIQTGNDDSTMGFRKRALYPHPLARRIKVSKKLLRVAVLNVDAIVRQRLAYKFGIVEENAFLNGNGSNQPLGVFTASDDGISTSRDVSTSNTTTQIKADNLIECKYTLKQQYRRNARWTFHRDALKMIRKLKDGDGNYLWRAGIASDRPDTVLDLPFDETEYAPNTFTSGLYVGLLGDWMYYWITDAMNMTIQVLTELYAETNQNGYIGQKETDGMPVLEEAFVRVKLA